MPYNINVITAYLRFILMTDALEIFTTLLVKAYLSLWDY